MISSLTSTTGPSFEGKHGAVVVVVLWLASLSLNALAAEAAPTFKRLSAGEFRTRIVGHVITDDTHWTDSFLADGMLRSTELGEPVTGTWRFQGEELWMIRRDREKRVETQCIEIWIAGQQIEYRRDGMTVNWDSLRDK